MIMRLPTRATAPLATIADRNESSDSLTYNMIPDCLWHHCAHLPASSGAECFVTTRNTCIAQRSYAHNGSMCRNVVLSRSPKHLGSAPHHL